MSIASKTYSEMKLYDTDAPNMKAMAPNDKETGATLSYFVKSAPMLDEDDDSLSDFEEEEKEERPGSKNQHQEMVFELKTKNEN